jgi:hypothetical protein
MLWKLQQMRQFIVCTSTPSMSSKTLKKKQNQANTTCTFNQIETLHREGIKFDGANLCGWLFVHLIH